MNNLTAYTAYRIAFISSLSSRLYSKPFNFGEWMVSLYWFCSNKTIQPRKTYIHVHPVDSIQCIFIEQFI